MRRERSKNVAEIMREREGEKIEKGDQARNPGGFTSSTYFRVNDNYYPADTLTPISLLPRVP